jgi:hypothetical protein
MVLKKKNANFGKERYVIILNIRSIKGQGQLFLDNNPSFALPGPNTQKITAEGSQRKH